MAIWNGTKFVDALPQTRAAESRSNGKTADAKDCGCPAVPSAKRSATTDKAWRRARWTDHGGVVGEIKMRRE